MKTLRLALPIILFFVACTKTDIELPPDIPSGGNFNVDKATALQLVNNIRQSGCTCGSDYMPPVSPITWNDLLAQAAYDHSKDMNQNNFFSHTGSDGSNPGTRITRRGYTWRTYGENIAKGYANEQAVINGWINSPGHCKNLMNASFREMGMGREGEYWTQDFGAR